MRINRWSFRLCPFNRLQSFTFLRDISIFVLHKTIRFKNALISFLLVFHPVFPTLLLLWGSITIFHYYQPTVPYILHKYRKLDKNVFEHNTFAIIIAILWKTYSPKTLKKQSEKKRKYISFYFFVYFLYYLPFFLLLLQLLLFLQMTPTFVTVWHRHWQLSTAVVYSVTFYKLWFYVVFLLLFILYYFFSLLVYCYLQWPTKLFFIMFFVTKMTMKSLLFLNIKRNYERNKNISF